ncbi:MAG: hypothetical protein IH627_21335 [Rubrivivax sp.]|nr:hypothetical protein [Rubrivivax sp.]
MKRHHPKFFLDANCVNTRQKNDALNRLEALRKQRLITLLYADVTHSEAGHGSQTRTDKAASYTYTKFEPYCEGNDATKRAIEIVLFPEGARTQNQKNDVLAVYHAERLRWPLVTMDGASNTQPGGILGNAGKLEKLGVEVLTPEQAIERAERLLKNAAFQETHPK